MFGAQDQFPAIFYKGDFWTLSLRMCKAIYRHIRLKKDFVNVEEVNGIHKLRIPTVLMHEKKRTQERFEVRGRFSMGMCPPFHPQSTMSLSHTHTLSVVVHPSKQPGECATRLVGGVCITNGATQGHLTSCAR